MWTLPSFLKFATRTAAPVDAGPAAAVAGPMLTPCIGWCEMGSDGFCDGCHRNVAEIARWASMEEFERRLLMDEILPRRAAERGPGPK